MTWTDFKKLNLRVNGAVVAIGWIWLFTLMIWHGSVTFAAFLNLVLLTGIAVILVSMICFLACHSWLYWRANSHVKSSDRSGNIALFAGLGGWALIVAMAATGQEPNDAIVGPIIVVSAACLIYWFLRFQKRYLRWFFMPSA